MKKLLIISPGFPPLNSVDSHRVRMFLRHAGELNWKVTVLKINPNDMPNAYRDDVLLETIPSRVCQVNVPMSKSWLFTLCRINNPMFRSFFGFYKKGKEIIKGERIDLVFISTTYFHSFFLGWLWNMFFKIPYVLDFQDPWRSDFYWSRPRSERPRFFLLNYLIDAILEKLVVRKSSGIIAVSQKYLDDLSSRYNINKIPKLELVFGACKADFDLVETFDQKSGGDKLTANNAKSIVYIGRGGYDMQPIFEVLFGAVSDLISTNALENDDLHVYLIGTSYAIAGTGKKTLHPIAEKMGIGSYVTEITDRISYVETLSLLLKADVLFVPGSADQAYSASKIFPYILSQRPLLTLFSSKSNVNEILKTSTTARNIIFDNFDDLNTKKRPELLDALTELLKYPEKFGIVDWASFQKYSDRSLSIRLADFFDSIV